MSRTRILLLLLVLLLFAACSPRVPREVVSQVTFNGEFADLRNSPEHYIGQFAILGGRIVEIQCDPSQSTMIVLQYPLDSNYRPRVDEPSGGRFLVRSSSFLDPAVYGPGSLVSAAGSISGRETRPVGEYPYAYPVMHLRQIWKWETERETYPRFQLGIGIGTFFR